MDSIELGMKVWVGCLACYNNGRLHGEWLNASEATNWHCGNPTHEEMWVFDLEYMPVREEMSPSNAQRWAELVDQFEPYDASEYAAFVVWVNNDSTYRDPSKADPDTFREAYRGTFESERDFAQVWAEEIGAIKDNASWPHDCIDWEWATRELMSDFWSGHTDHGVVIFENR